MNPEKVASLVKEAISEGASVGSLLHEYKEMLPPDVFQELFSRTPVSDIINYFPDRVYEIPSEVFRSFFESDPLTAVLHPRGQELLSDPSRTERMMSKLIESNMLRSDWTSLKKYIPFIPDEIVGTYGTERESDLSKNDGPADVLCVIMKGKTVSEDYISKQIRRTSPRFLSLYLDSDVIGHLKENDLLFIASSSSDEARTFPKLFWEMSVVRQSFLAVEQPEIVSEIILEQIKGGGDVPDVIVDFLLDTVKAEYALRLAKAWRGRG